jgi:hypothetical protein
MRRVLVGVLIGIAVTLAGVELVGGWWEYSIVGEEACKRQQFLGATHVAPHQPNPCLFRSPRFLIGR